MDGSVRLEVEMERLDSDDSAVKGVLGLSAELELAVDACEMVDVIEGRLPERFGSWVVAKVAIFIPRLVLVLAGMKRVVWLFVAGIAMR